MNGATGLRGLAGLVTAASEFSPTALANLHLWLDAASAYVTRDGSNYITTWADRGPNAFNATASASNGANKALWVDAARKSNPVVRFTDYQYFEANSVATALSGSDKPFTVFAVVKRTAPITVNGHVYCLSHQVNGPVLVTMTSTGANQQIGVYRRSDDNVLKSALSQNGQSDGEWCLLTQRFTGTTTEVRRNGTSILTTSALDAGVATMNRFTVGVQRCGLDAIGNSFWTGDMAEIVMYNRSLTDGEVDQLEAWLAAKYFYGLAEANTTYLTTPTYEASGEALHPSVVYRAAGWNSYKYWMAMTPYPDMNDEYEDPSILCSNDGTTWTVPVGLTNPIDNGGSTPNHNADPELFWNADYTKLYCFWTHWTNASSTYRVYRMESTDGATWTNKTQALSGTGYQFVSPGIVFDGDSYRMYVVDITTSPNTIRYRTADTLDGTWSAPNTCTISGIPTGRDPWHLSVYLSGGTYVMLLDTCTLDVSGTEARLGLATSSDGVTWTFRGEMMFKSGTGWDNGYMYRSTMIPLGDNQWDLFYSGINNLGTPNRHPHIARTTLTTYLTGATETITTKTPDQVTGLWQWLKADAGITKDGSDLVSAWADQSGGGRNVTQGTAANKPLWVDAVYNTLPAIRFGGNDYLDGGAIGPASGANARCIMAVVRNVSTPAGAYNHLLHYGTDQSGQAYGLTIRAYTGHTGGKVGPGNHYWGSGMADDDACPTHAILTIYFDGTTDRLRVNGVEAATSTPTLNTVTNGGYKVGCRVTPDEYFTGDLCELAVWSVQPSSADLQAVEAYLRQRWIG